jgi:ankyrin repeat protein
LDVAKEPLVCHRYDNISCVEALIHQSLHDINDDDMDGHTPLLLACQHGHQGCVQVLLALGADVSKRDDEHRTALMLAAANGHAAVMRILLENHAKCNDVDKMKVILH